MLFVFVSLCRIKNRQTNFVLLIALHYLCGYYEKL